MDVEPMANDVLEGIDWGGEHMAVVEVEGREPYRQLRQICEAQL